MTTSTGLPPAASSQTRRHRAQPSTRTGVTQLRVLRSEWIKVRSLRSTTITLGLSAVAMIGIGLLASAIASGDVTPRGGGPGGGGGGRLAAADPTSISLGGADLVQIIVAVLGVLVITSEYSSGMIRATFAAVPRRLPVLWAKLVVTAVVTLVVGEVAAVVAFLGGQAVLSAGGHHTAALGDPGVLRAVLGTGVTLALVAALGVAFGALLRSTAGAISSLLGVLLLLPGLAALLLPSSWQNDVIKVLPSAARAAFTSVTPAADQLSPWIGLAVLAGWVAVFVVGAAVRMVRTDA